MTSNVNAIAQTVPHGSLVNSPESGAQKSASALVRTEKALCVHGPLNSTMTRANVSAHLGAVDLAQV